MLFLSYDQNFPIFDEISFKIKRVQMYEHLSNYFQHIYCRSIESSLNIPPNSFKLFNIFFLWYLCQFFDSFYNTYDEWDLTYCTMTYASLSNHWCIANVWYLLLYFFVDTKFIIMHLSVEMIPKNYIFVIYYVFNSV